MKTVSMLAGAGLLSLALAGLAMAQEAAGGTSAKKAEIGKAAPEFDLKDCCGKAVKLSDYKDKIVVLEWWNNECPWCVKAMPQMKQLNEKYGSKGVVFLGVDSTAAHKPEGVHKAREDHGVQYPILMDTDGKVGRAYGAKTTPHIFIINKGTLVYAGAHYEKDGSRDYIAESLDALLAGKAVPVAETKSYGCSVKYK
ncbi:MAG: redoxin domain-containing protein [Phycisphaerae bacterium]|nr:redoxin domain-containing protein [Phycisphaerae bacterium]MCZ2401074.1 redoxin domain-containing protein [Phycisphaerae bacterium]NUQ48895.1 redoxin domain-containing protein [Phycisphaerae bacterium]